jgi:dUTPase
MPTIAEKCALFFFNHSVIPFHIHRGEGTGWHNICEKIEYPEICEVLELDKTERDTGGFSSTGRN